MKKAGLEAGYKLKFIKFQINYIIAQMHLKLEKNSLEQEQTSVEVETSITQRHGPPLDEDIKLTHRVKATFIGISRTDEMHNLVLDGSEKNDASCIP